MRIFYIPDTDLVIVRKTDLEKLLKEGNPLTPDEMKALRNAAWRQIEANRKANKSDYSEGVEGSSILFDLLEGTKLK